jgi:hypothetical protein
LFWTAFFVTVLKITKTVGIAIASACIGTMHCRLAKNHYQCQKVTQGRWSKEDLLCQEYSKMRPLTESSSGVLISQSLILTYSLLGFSRTLAAVTANWAQQLTPTTSGTSPLATLSGKALQTLWAKDTSVGKSDFGELRRISEGQPMTQTQRKLT